MPLPPNHNILRDIRIGLLIFLFNSLTWALPADQKQPLQLSADHTTIDYRNRLSTYIGHVQLQQGTIRADADKMQVYYDAQHAIERIILTGRPAHYQSQPSPDKPLLFADADTITFLPKTHDAFFIHNAHIKQGEYEATSPHITYNTETEVMQLESNQRERAVMVFTPISPPP